jgi:hypothetical protein
MRMPKIKRRWMKMALSIKNESQRIIDNKAIYISNYNKLTRGRRKTRTSRRNNNKKCKKKSEKMRMS